MIVSEISSLRSFRCSYSKVWKKSIIWFNLCTCSRIILNETRSDSGVSSSFRTFFRGLQLVLFASLWTTPHVLLDDILTEGRFTESWWWSSSVEDEAESHCSTTTSAGNPVVFGPAFVFFFFFFDFDDEEEDAIFLLIFNIILVRPFWLGRTCLFIMLRHALIFFVNDELISDAMFRFCIQANPLATKIIHFKHLAFWVLKINALSLVFVFDARFGYS